MEFRAGERILLHVVVSTIFPSITSVCSGSVWPSGWYGLPEPVSGCPSAEWGSGWWYEDRRLNNQSTARVPQHSHLRGTFTQEITKRYFCMKKKDNGLNNPWPDGLYCIYQWLLKPCPPGFVKGSKGWKNKVAPNNNKQSGMVPSGVFAGNTRINYCCRIDGSKENSISLPINRPFFLLAYNSSQCQSVKWARTTQEYLRFSVQEKMTFQGFHPFVDDNYALRYCYYQGSNQTLTTSNGTVSRYLNQTSIHQERHTAWHINPNSSTVIEFLVLRFTRFTFHASSITSYLEVFDGCNESAPSLGRFSSTQSPLGQNITSSTNQLFVVLQIGDRSGTYDFEFNYHICSPTVSTTAEIKMPSNPPTPSTTKVTSPSPYESSSKVTSLSWTTVTSIHYNNVTIPTNRTGTQLHLHGNNMLLLYTLLPTGCFVIVIVIVIMGLMIGRQQRKSRIAYSIRLASPSIDEIVSELNGTSCAVTSDEHQPENGFSRRTRLKLMDTTERTSSDSDDELICLD